MTSRQVPTSPEGKFGQQLTQFIAGMLRAQRFVIPTFAADPPETDPTNLWMRWDGRLRGRYWNGTVYVYVDYPMRSDITSPPAVPAYPAAPAQPSPPQSRTRIWTAQWSQTYQSSGAKRTDTTGETQIVFGTETGNAYGYQEALLGFDYADIATQLAGSTIQSVAISFTTLSTFTSGGTTAALGMHTNAAEPTTYTATDTVLRYSATAFVVAGQTATYPLPLAYGQQLRSGTAKGVVVEAPNSDPAFAGMIAGVASGYTPPQLLITYAK